MGTKNAVIKIKDQSGTVYEVNPKTGISNVEGLQTALNGKVSTVSGKGLSTNDYTTTEKNKLAGIAAGATANIGTVTQVKVGSTAYNPSSGVVSLPAYPTTLPASDVSSWAKASSKPTYTASEVGAIATTAKGAASGVAELDANGKVPSSQLPAYVDDVLEYTAKSSFPTTGETGKIYVDTTTNLTYRWSGSAYVEISPSLALGTTSSTAYRGDRGNTAYSHATDSSRLTTAQSSGLYKIATTAQGHIASVTAVAKSDITGLGIPGSDTNTHRPIQVNGTQVLGDNTTALNLKAGSNVSLSNSSGTVTIAATDTTYSSKSAASGGTDVSLVTTGEKYTWNNKGNGTVTSVKVGSTSYSPSSGVVSLPAYPTTLPASDVYSWAKASSKPSYTASEVGLGNVGNFKAVSTVANQGLSSTEKSNARTNIGAGTSSFSGSYNDLSNKPTIDSAFSSSSTNAVQNKVITSELAALIDDGAKNYAYIPDYTNQSGAGYYSDIYFNIPAGDWVLSYNLTTSANFAVAVTIDGTEQLYYDNSAPYSGTRIYHKLNTATSGITRFRVYFNTTGTIYNIMICKLSDWNISQKFVPYRTTLNTLTYRMRSYTISSGAPVKMPLVRSETFTMLLFGFVQTIGCVFWALENMSGNTITVRDVYSGQTVSQSALNFSLNVGDHMLTITTNISSNSNFMIMASTA